MGWVGLPPLTKGRVGVGLDSIFKNSSSVMIFIPSSVAFESFVPAFSPATTYVVFLETDDEMSPPPFLTISLASSRENCVNVPVNTKVRPASGSRVASTSDAFLHFLYVYPNKKLV